MQHLNSSPNILQGDMNARNKVDTEKVDVAKWKEPLPDCPKTAFEDDENVADMDTLWAEEDIDKLPEDFKIENKFLTEEDTAELLANEKTEDVAVDAQKEKEDGLTEKEIRKQKRRAEKEERRLARRKKKEDKKRLKEEAAQAEREMYELNDVNKPKSKETVKADTHDSKAISDLKCVYSEVSASALTFDPQLKTRGSLGVVAEGHQGHRGQRPKTAPIKGSHEDNTGFVKDETDEEDDDDPKEAW